MIHNDHLGTPQKMTDSTGTVVWSADYKPFGEATVMVSTITNNLRFPGQYYDAETGLNYNYYRDYNPIIGRYIEADPLGLQGGMNLYGYVSGNPINLKDPTGLEECKHGRYVPCEKMDFINKWICKKAADESCRRTGYGACCELEKTGCMGCAENECDDAKRNAKKAICVAEYERCLTGASPSR